MIPLKWNAAGMFSEGVDYEVQIEFVPAADFAAAGYHAYSGGWYMRFTRGGCHAGAYHHSLPEAQANAARIVNYMRDSHDALGNPVKRKHLVGRR